jgi:hypothetical protein
MMSRFARYVDKVFHFGALIQGLSDARPKPQIPTGAVFLSALMMFVTRLGSLNALEGQLRFPRRWNKVLGRRLPSADRMGPIMDLIDPEALRERLSAINHRLRRNKLLDDNPWALRFAALDAHEFFSLHQALLPPVQPTPDHRRRPESHPVLPSRRRGPFDRL